MRRPADRYVSFRKRLDAFTCEMEGIHKGDVEAMHRARIASRRLRELIPLLELDHVTTRDLGRRLRKVTRRLGRVREFDVVTSAVQELGHNPRYSPTTLTQVSEVLAEADGAERERLAAKLSRARMKRLARRLERTLKDLEPDDQKRQPSARQGSGRAWVWALEARVTRRGAGVRAAIEAAGAVYVPGRLHDVRIALKKLRYAVELLLESRNQRSTGDLAAVKAAQDLLGRLHDLEVLALRIREAQTSSSPDLRSWHRLGAFVRAVEDDCRILHARYMRDRTGLMAITARVAGSQVRTAPGSRRAAG